MTCPAELNIEQTLFLGCSVRGFSCNLGWNEQVTTVDIELVRDECASPSGSNKVYYDILNHPTSPKRTWTAADPGLKSFGTGFNEYPRLGAPCYFRYGDFEFCGLLQDWQRIRPQSDKEEYTVKLVSPVEILAGVQVLLGEYTGPVVGYNILNVYGFQEYFSGKACTSWTDPRYPQDGVIFGSRAGGIGGANLNEAGMPWSKIKQGVSILTSSFINSSQLGFGAYSEYGRICGKGGNENYKFGLLNPDATNIELGTAFAISDNVATYLIDISELPESVDSIRIVGPVVNLLELITEITNRIGYDYYIELVPVNIGGTIYKIIKVRTVSRNSVATVGRIEDYINNLSEVQDSSYGREFRNETTTNFVIGGQKQNIWQVENGLPDPDDDPDETFFDDTYGSNTYVRDRIVPFYGIDTEGNIYVEYSDGDDQYIVADFRVLKKQLNTLGSYLPNTGRVDFTEILMAGGGFNQWVFYTTLANTIINQALASSGLTLPTTFRKDALVNFTIDKAVGRDLVKLSKHNQYVNDLLRKDLEHIHDFIKGIYDNYYNYLMVRIPNICGLKQNGQTILSDEVVDGGWTEASNVLGLPNPGGYLDIFRNEDGSIKHIAQFVPENNTGGFDSIIGTKDDPVLVYNSGVYTALDSTNRIVFADNDNYKSARVIMQSPKVNENEELDLIFNGWARSADRITALLIDASIRGQVVDILREDVEGELLKFAQGPRPVEPQRVAIATKSNVETYGPWKANNLVEAGPPGQINIEKDDSLVPWTYGSVANMNTVGQAKANIGVTLMDEVESGFVKVPGIPSIPIGSELCCLEGLNSEYYNTNQHLFENRVFSANTHNLSDPNGNSTAFVAYGVTYATWTGYFGPQVSNILYTFRDNEVSTTYNFRTFSPKFGFLSKLNAERISRRLSLENNRRKLYRLELAVQDIQNKSFGKTSRFKADNSPLDKKGDVHKKDGTPHSVFVGSLVNWSSTSYTGALDNDFKRSIINTKSLSELSNNMGSTGTGVGSVDPFDSLAIMSLDGLIRPVSLRSANSVSGLHDLPGFSNIQFYDYWSGTNLLRATNNDRALTSEPGPAIHFTGSGPAGLAPYQSNKDIVTHYYLNPFTNPTGSGSRVTDITTALVNNRVSGTPCGHDIDIVARNDLNYYTGSGASLIMTTDNSGYHSPFRGDYCDDYRFLALRGPLVLHGWGYDTCGKPVPNLSDDDNVDAHRRDYYGLASGEEIQTAIGLTDKFAPDFLKKPEKWPVGPVDLRYDRERGVWAAPMPRPMEYASFDIDGIYPAGPREGTPGNSGDIVDFCHANLYYIDPTGATYLTRLSDHSGGGDYEMQVQINWGHYRGRTIGDGEIFSTFYSQKDNSYHIVAADDVRILPGYIAQGTSPPARFLDSTGLSGVGPPLSGSCSLMHHSYLNDDIGLSYGGRVGRIRNIHTDSNMSEGDHVILIPNRSLVNYTKDGHGDRGDQIWAMHTSILPQLASLTGFGPDKWLYASGSTKDEIIWAPLPTGDNYLPSWPGGTTTLINTGGGPEWNEDFRLVRGYVTADVDPADATFTINTVVALANGADPGSPLTVNNKFGRRYFDSSRIHAAYNKATDEWDDLGYQTLIMRGTVQGSVSCGDTTFTVDNVAAIGGTYENPDPLTVRNDLEREYADNAAVVFIYDPDITADWRDITVIGADPVPVITNSAITAAAVAGGNINYGSGPASIMCAIGTDTGDDTTIYNVSEVAIPSNTPLIAHKNGRGDYIVQYNTGVGGEGGVCLNSITGITCALDYSDGYIYLTNTLLDCTGGSKEQEPCAAYIPLPELCTNAITGYNCTLDYSSEVLSITNNFIDCTGGSLVKSCSVEIPTDVSCNAVKDVACNITSGSTSIDVAITGHYCDASTFSSNCNIGTIVVPVITGRADPFVTFDVDGNPTWNFATANVRVLSVAGGGTVSCSAGGVASC